LKVTGEHINRSKSKFSKDNVGGVSNIYGTYELADSDQNVVYIGEGKLYDRLMAHFAKGGSDPIPGVSYFRYEETRSKQKAEQRQNALLSEFERKYGKLPKHNQKSRG